MWAEVKIIRQKILYFSRIKYKNMADVPFVRGKVVWLYTIPQFILIFSLFWLFSSFTEDRTDMIYGILVYWFIIYALRNVIARQHRQGVALLKRNNFEQSYHMPYPILRLFIHFIAGCNILALYQTRNLLEQYQAFHIVFNFYTRWYRRFYIKMCSGVGVRIG
jgi:hypothetical protein